MGVKQKRAIAIIFWLSTELLSAFASPVLVCSIFRVILSIPLSSLLFHTQYISFPCSCSVFALLCLSSEVPESLVESDVNANLYDLCVALAKSGSPSVEEDTKEEGKASVLKGTDLLLMCCIPIIIVNSQPSDIV